MLSKSASHDSLVDLEREELGLLEPGERASFGRGPPKDGRKRLYMAIGGGLAALMLLASGRHFATGKAEVLEELPPPEGLSRRSPAPSRFIYAAGIKRYAPISFSTPATATLDQVFKTAAKVERAYKPAQCSTSAAHDARYQFFDSHKVKVLFAISYAQSANVIMTAIHSLPEIIETLGPENVHVSITEGGSKDTTVRLLHLLAQAVRISGASFTIQVEGDSTDPAAWKDNRLDILCKARNDAIEDIQTDVAEAFGGFDAVIISNDVVWCKNDVLELVMQHVTQGSDMLCAADYNELWGPSAFANLQVVLTHTAHFYDAWVARDLLGQAFYHVRHWEWGDLEAVLPDNPPDQRMFNDGLPFQVFSCWNGLLISRPEPFLPPHNIRLRNYGSGVISEAFIFNQDLWAAGFTKIAMHPRVKVAYEVPQYGDKTQASNSTGFDLLDNTQISWNPSPPPKVEYFDYHVFSDPILRAWNWHPREADAPDR